MGAYVSVVLHVFASACLSVYVYVQDVQVYTCTSVCNGVHPTSIRAFVSTLRHMKKSVETCVTSFMRVRDMPSIYECI
jgi:hypothetical protein